ncbi:hypothetical protein KAU92_03175, partial [Candidatus Bathyarchaeota archaeon]|nr:hypothetical protein [Candidatus Bathyarchaeota archaeon]
SKAVRQIRLFINEEKAQELRDKLFMYRFKMLGKNIDNSGMEEFFKTNGYWQNARVIELFISLLQVAPTEEIRQRLLTCMKQITQSRLDAEQASIEARVFDALLACEESVQKGKISTQAITDAFNLNLREKEQVSSRFIGRRVVGLGFEKCRLAGGPAGYFWDPELIERLRKRYYPTPSGVTSLTSQTSQTSLNKEKTAQDSQSSSEVSEEISVQVDSGKIEESPLKSEVSEVTLEKVPTLQEIVEAVKPKLKPMFTEEKLLTKIMNLGVSRDAAEKRVQHFIRQGIVMRDDIGGCYFV